MDTTNYATVWLGCIVGLVDYRDSDYYRFHRVALVVAVAGNGRYIQTVQADSTGEFTGEAHWNYSYKFYRLADSKNEYLLVRKVDALESRMRDIEREEQYKRERELKQLSQNTVTRALVHASDNGYCSETAVALISAGHKLPDVTLELEVTMRLSVTLEGKSNYYPLRALFGATRGDVEGASGIYDVERSGTIRDAIHEQLGYDGDIESVSHVGTSVEWHEPMLRMVSVSEAQDEISNQASEN